MKYLVAIIFALTLGFVTLGVSQNVNAADKNDFNAGNIIDDVVFYNSNAMNSSQIQTFLESKNPNCDYNGTQSAADWGYPNLTHAQIAEYKRNGSNGFSRDSSFHAPPYRCLTMYNQATPQMEAASGYCSAIGAGTRTAAQIINDVAKACGINPQVLIILLEKEQSLITDKWPLDRQLRNATGFACPDTAPCDPSYAGFFYQVYHAARQFKVYQAFPNSYNYRAGRNNNIYWNPDLNRCGSSTVYIQNQATAALYIYTPYRPNEAALNNLYGTGDSCSAYGNRNFWRIFTDWFGSTKGQLPFQNMEKGRWMQIESDTYKKDLSSTNKSNVDWILGRGQQIYFTSKITIDGVTYLRSQYDHDRNQNKGIPDSMLEEVPVNYVPMEQARWMKASKEIIKVDPVTNRAQTSSNTSTYVSKDRWVYVSSKIEIGGKVYLRSFFDSERNLQAGIDGSLMQDVQFSYEPLERPRWLAANQETQVYDLRDTEKTTSSKIQLDNKSFYDHKIYLNGNYYLISGLPTSNSFVGVPLNALRDISASDIKDLNGQRAYRIVDDVEKLDLHTGLAADEEIVKKDRIVYFQGTITLNNTTYLRSAFDTNLNKTTVIPIDKLEAVPLSFASMQTPRTLRVTQDTYKIDPITGQQLDFKLQKGSTIAFAEKIEINNIVYLRTLFDTTKGDYKVVPLSLLSDL